MNAIAFCIDGNLFIGKIIPQADGSESQGWKCIAQLYYLAKNTPSIVYSQRRYLDGDELAQNLPPVFAILLLKGRYCAYW